MTKEKISFFYRVKHLFIYHPWLKIIALIVAVIIWFYTRDEMSKFNY